MMLWPENNDDNSRGDNSHSDRANNGSFVKLAHSDLFANQAALIPCIEASPHQRPFQIKYRPAVCSFSELYTTSFYDWISTDNHGGHPLSYKTPSADVPLKSTPAAHRLKTIVLILDFSAVAGTHPLLWHINVNAFCNRERFTAPTGRSFSGNIRSPFRDGLVYKHSWHPKC